MNKYIVISIVIVIASKNFSFSQKVNDQIDRIKKNSIVLNSSKFNATNDSDLEKLKEQIKDKKIIIVGEHFHSDGQTLMMKTRLIKFLHEQMGFEVFLYELPYIDINRLNTFSKTEEDFLIGMHQNMWGISINQVDFFKYLYKSRDSNHPLYFEGIDIGLVSSYKGSIQELDSTFKSYTNDSHFFGQWTKLKSLLSWFYANHKSKNIYTKVRVYIDSLKANLNNFPIDDSIRNRIILSLDNIFFDVDSGINHPKNNKNVFNDYDNIRDKCMADNIINLYENIYKGKKIIISVSNHHASRKLTNIKNYKLKSVKSVTMTDYLYERYGNELYSIATISYEGYTGDSLNGYNSASTNKAGKVVREGNQHFKYPKMKKESIEYILKKGKCKYVFLDFSELQKKEKWLAEYNYMFPLGYKPVKAIWPNIFDGVIYIEKMEINISYSIEDWLKYMPKNDIYKAARIYSFGKW
jgi:erythromycin esterase